MNQKRIELLQSYIEKEPDDPFNRYALAMEYYEIDIPKAQKILVDLSKKHPDYLPTYFKAAHLFWETEERDKASHFLQLVFSLQKIKMIKKHYRN